MSQQRDSISASIEHKKQLLNAIYSEYSTWVSRFPLACQKGCAACCTQSVTISSLEGELILDFVSAQGRDKWLLDKLARTITGKSRSIITTNQFAEACLKHQAVDSDALGCWDFTPCIFLEDAACSIYEARPFGCRSFGSLVRCTAGRAAEMVPVHLTVNTVFTQIVEHLSSDNGCWATMMDILHSLAYKKNMAKAPHVLKARPVPGFLLEPLEMNVVRELLQKLRGRFSDLGGTGDLIDNLLPI